jgi:hypothetical protein
VIENVEREVAPRLAIDVVAADPQPSSRDSDAGELELEIVLRIVWERGLE